MNTLNFDIFRGSCLVPRDCNQHQLRYPQAHWFRQIYYFFHLKEITDEFLRDQF